ncbi:hypothetical protein [Caballeronia grimmiae]|uniref:hypothetical protein n=1 Tax=Caballeronia grimmiae TaxID=1071679 RepID=UPI0038B94EE1
MSQDKLASKISAPGRVSLRDLTADELLALRELNAGLHKTELWIRERASRYLASCEWAGSTSSPSQVGGARLDKFIDAKVLFTLHKYHPGYDQTADNFIAELDASAIALSDGEITTFNFNDMGEPAPHPLDDMTCCFLFHDLYDHFFEGDWGKLLCVGSIWAEVSVTEQMISTPQQSRLMSFRARPATFD